MRKNLLLSGLVASSSGSSSSSDGSIEATKPAWETGAKAAISLRPKPAAAAAPKAWTLDGDDELVDDEALLTEEDKVRVSIMLERCLLGGRRNGSLPGFNAGAAHAGVASRLPGRRMLPPCVSCHHKR